MRFFIGLKNAILISLVLWIVIFGAIFAFSEDQIITIKIPEAKVTTALEGFLTIYPNVETIDDPEWVDPEDGSEVPQIKKYTTKEWVTEQIRRIVVRDIRRGLQMKSNAENQVLLDNEMVVTQ